MANWRDLEEAADQLVVGGVFSESVRLSFMRDGAMDPDRALVEIDALLAAGGDDAQAIGTGDDRLRARLTLGEAELFIDRSTYAGPLPRKGDRVRANDRPGQPWFEVASVSDRYSNLIVLTLGMV